MAKTIVKKNVKKKSKPKPSPEDILKMDELAESIMTGRQEGRDISTRVSEAQAELIDMMDKFGMSTRTFKGSDGHQHNVNKQQTIAQVIDQPKLKKKVGAKLWDKITTRSLDKKKMDAFIASGELDAAIVAQCMTEKPSSPFVKVQ